MIIFSFLFLLSIPVATVAQNNAIKVDLSITDNDYRLHHYSFKVYKQNEKKPIQEIYLTDPDSTFMVNDLESAIYFIQFITIYGTYLYRDLNLIDNKYLELQIELPPDVCCYALPIVRCPHGHYNKVVKVIYGYPTRYSLFRARYKRIHLGGCMVTDCDPNYYCKKHNIYF